MFFQMTSFANQYISVFRWILLFMYVNLTDCTIQFLYVFSTYLYFIMKNLLLLSLHMLLSRLLISWTPFELRITSK